MNHNVPLYNNYPSDKCRIKVLPPSFNNFQLWDRFVEKHPQGTIYHLSGWKKVLEESFRHIKGQIIVIWDEQANEIVAGLPIYYVSSFLTRKRIVAAPFANFTDLLIRDTDDGLRLADHFVKIFHLGGLSHIEIKTKHKYAFLENSGFKGASQYVHHFLPLNQAPEVLLNQFHKKAVRRSIHKAIENGLELKKAKNFKDVSIFYQIYFKARRRMGLPAMPSHYFLKLWEVFHPTNRLELILCLSNGLAIGGAILLKFKNSVSIEFGHDLYEYRKLCVNHFLDWRSIELARQEGYNNISFGRTSYHNKGLITYKDRWGTTAKDLMTYVYQGATYSNLSDKEITLQYRMVKQMCLRSPAFLYKLISAAAYRHLG